MPTRLRTLEQSLAWCVLLVAVLNFTPAVFSQDSLTEEAAWTKVLKDVPVLAMVVLLLARGGATRWPRIARKLAAAISIRAVGRSLRGAASQVEVTASFLVAVGVMAGFIAASVLLIEPPSFGTLVSARYYVVYPALALLLAFSKPLPLRPLAIGVVVLACLQTVVAALDFMGAWGNTFYAGEIELAGYLFPRAIGTLGNPNNLGIFLGLALILVLSTGHWRSRLGAAAVAILALGILLTFSKTVLIALSVTYASVIWAQGPQRRVVRMLLIAGGVVALVAVVGASRLSAPDTVSGAFGSRGDTARKALENWTEGPMEFILGHGFASQTSLDASGAIDETVIDSMPLALGVEGGVVGIVLFGLVVVLGLRLAFNRPTAEPLGMVTRRYAILFMVYTPLAVNFRLFPGALFFWLLIGLSARSARAAATASSGGELPEQSAAVDRGSLAASVP